MNEHYVYLISRPDDRPCYVGKGKGDRLRLNLRNSHNPIVRRIVRDAGGTVPHRKILENVSESEAFEFERFLIQEIGRMPNGPLVNMTDGGDGVTGHIRTPEQRAAMSAARMGRKLSDEQRLKQSKTMKAKLAAQPYSAEHGAAISAAKKGKSQGSLSESHRAAIGNAHRGRKISDAHLKSIRAAAAMVKASEEKSLLKSERISKALTGKKLSAAQCEAISLAQQNLSPEVREHRSRLLSEAGTGRKRSPESCAKTAAAHKGMKRSAETQEAMSEAQRASA